MKLDTRILHAPQSPVQPWQGRQGYINTSDILLESQHPQQLTRDGVVENVALQNVFQTIQKRHCNVTDKNYCP